MMESTSIGPVAAARKAWLPGATQSNKNAVHFSSATDNWSTPQWFYDELVEIFGSFDLDPCASPSNAKCKRFFTPAEDGLAQPWNGSVFMNPPYGRVIGRWVCKAYEEYARGNCRAVCLLPARPDTRWWHDWVKDKAIVHFVKGRLKFGNGRAPAPFPSAVVIYGVYGTIHSCDPVVSCVAGCDCAERMGHPKFIE